jgi:3-oxoacyl-[acyl-carrier protein] reductase
MAVDLGLAGRGALITAASRGLGRAIALALAAEGCRVAVCARGEEGLRHVRVQLEKAGAAQVVTVQADVDEEEGRRRLYAQVEAELGVPWVVVANCGNPVSGGVDGLPEWAWKDAGRKLRAMVELMRWAAHGMAEQGGGVVIGLLSRTAVEPDRSLFLSSLLRPALLSWAKMLSQEVGPRGVRVVSVLPGLCQTESVEEQLLSQDPDARRLPLPQRQAELARRLEEAAQHQGASLRALGDPVSLGHLVAFLASPLCQYVTGSAVRFDGGAVRAP